MKTLHPSDLTALVVRLAGLSLLVTDTTFVGYVNSLFGSHGAQAIAVLGLVATLAADFIRINALPASTVVNATTTTQTVTTATNADVLPTVPPVNM